MDGVRGSVKFKFKEERVKKSRRLKGDVSWRSEGGVNGRPPPRRAEMMLIWRLTTRRFDVIFIVKRF